MGRKRGRKWSRRFRFHSALVMVQVNGDGRVCWSFGYGSLVSRARPLLQARVDLVKPETECAILCFAGLCMVLIRMLPSNSNRPAVLLQFGGMVVHSEIIETSPSDVLPSSVAG